MTKTMAAEWVPLLEAYSKGRKLQHDHNSAGKGQWQDMDVPDMSMHPSWIRIKPEPRKVPLTAEDIPAVCWIKQHATITPVYIVKIIYHNGIVIGDNSGVHCFAELMETNWQYSTDRKTWKPCWKEVSE